ncbi:hypothetical protein PG984_003002 [Apiospora sp. TS-2023a]
MSASNGNNIADNVVAPATVQAAANYLYGRAYLVDGVEMFKCLEDKQEDPNILCNAEFLNKSHSHSNHKSRKHHGQALRGPNGDGSGISSRGAKGMKTGLTRYQMKTAKIDVECKYCPGSKSSNPLSLVGHYRAAPAKHENKGSEEQVFGDYKELAHLLPNKDADIKVEK